MASIHKHTSGTSPFWFGKYRDEIGVVRFRSTKQRTRREAQAVADGWEHAARFARDKRLGKAQAMRIVSEILERTTGETIGDTTIQKHFDEWLAAKKIEAAPTSFARYKAVKELFLAHLGHRAQHSLATLTRQDVQSYINNRLRGESDEKNVERESGLAPKTVLVDFRALSNCFKFAGSGVLFENPCRGVVLPKLKSSTRETFTDAQIKLLVKTARGDWRTCILLGYYCGQRLQDCANQRVENVSLTDNTITFYPGKTSHAAEKEEDNKIVMPMATDLQKHLMELMSTDEPREFLCPSLAGKDSGGAHGLSQTFKQIIRDAGLSPKTAKGKGIRQFSKLTFHSLRHSFNSSLANAGVKQEVRMQLAGHASTAVNDGYTHLELATLRGAVEKLPSVLP